MGSRAGNNPSRNLKFHNQGNQVVKLGCQRKDLEGLAGRLVGIVS